MSNQSNQQLPDELLWESVEVGLNHMIQHNYGAAFWVKVAFITGGVGQFVDVRLWHSIPGRAAEVIYHMALPLQLERDLPDPLVVASTTEALYNPLADIAHGYMMQGPATEQLPEDEAANAQFGYLSDDLMERLRKLTGEAVIVPSRWLGEEMPSHPMCRSYTPKPDNKHVWPSSHIFTVSFKDQQADGREE